MPPLEFTSFVDLAQQVGPLILAVLFFMWRDWRREIHQSERISKLEDEIREAVLGKLDESTKAITKNTEVLTRVEKRFDDWTPRISTAH